MDLKSHIDHAFAILRRYANENVIILMMQKKLQAVTRVLIRHPWLPISMTHLILGVIALRQVNLG